MYSLTDGCSEEGWLQKANGALRVRTDLLRVPMNKIPCVNRSWPAFLWTVITFGCSASPTTCTMIPEHQSLVIVNKWRNTCYFQIPKNHVPAINTASTVYNTQLYEQYVQKAQKWMTCYSATICLPEPRITFHWCSEMYNCDQNNHVSLQKKSVWCSEHPSTRLFPIFPWQRQLNSSFLLTL
jgi:hypothetical protein